MRWRSSDPSHTPWIAALLAATVLLVALLAVNATYAARSHRAVAEAVLRDYAALAGDELLRRVAAEVGYYGHLQALEVLRRGEATPGPASGKAGKAANAREERSLELVAWAFRLDTGDHALEILGEPPPNPASTALIDWLVQSAPVALARATEGDLAVLQNGARAFVVAPLETRAAEVDDLPPTLLGFELDRTRLEPWIAEALDRRPLLPPSLGSGELGNEVLYLRLTDASGSEIFRRGERYASALLVTRQLPEDYLQPLERLEVEAAVDPEAAARLVIGGLPRSRLPVLLGLVALTAGLFTAAVVLLRRERAVARLRTDFVSRVSHELRTPLTQIRMFAETLRLGRVRDDAERDRALEIIDRESRRLSGLVENVLQFSQAERGSLRLAKERIPLRGFLEGLVAEVTPLLGNQESSGLGNQESSGLGNQESSGDARVQIEALADLSLVADPDALRQSLLNLLDNAVKYGPSSQLVIVGAESIGGAVRLWVDDEGPGIDPAERDRVWRAFRRVENGASVSGTGIGLAVVRELVELHGGRCRIEDGSRGGARVALEFPDADLETEAP